MATVQYLLPTASEFYAVLQERWDEAENKRRKRFHAVICLQRMTRGYLIRKHIGWLSKNALIIQCAFRRHRARKMYRAALREAVIVKHQTYYANAATKITALWRGYNSRRKLFCYRRYRTWLAKVHEQGEKRLAEAEKFRLQSRADDLRILEGEARQWLAFVVFKLHHLLRTYVRSGIYSDPSTNEFTDFEKLIKTIHYTDYMKRLKRKYDDFVRKHRTQFTNKRLFPIIGDGADYWYLSLPEMQEMTYPISEKKTNTRHKDTHHGSIHKQPFLWKRIRQPPQPEENKGSFKITHKCIVSSVKKDTPCGDAVRDPRFHLYVKHYKPKPDVFDYIDLHINVLMTRKPSIENM